MVILGRRSQPLEHKGEAERKGGSLLGSPCVAST